MTDRKPDFYRVRFGEHLWATGDYRTHSNCVGYAKVFMRETEAQDFVTTTGGRIVPVYVKVTRKPKLHDFAWALKRMREGKRVRRAGQITHYICAKSYGGDLLPNCIRYNGPRGCGDVDDITTQDLTATDWQLYEAP